MVAVSVPRRGFVVFLQGDQGNDKSASGSFQSPEGDSLFFYEMNAIEMHEARQVSVPRRGFVVFLHDLSLCHESLRRGGFSPPKGIRCFSTG